MSSFDEKQKYCDVQFICVDANDVSGTGKSSVGAHKSILALKSDVFAAMFYGSLLQIKKETENHLEINITDIDIKIFKMLLSFIYGFDIEIDNVVDGCNFYYAAQKYNIKPATQFVSTYLTKNINPLNAIFVYESTLPYEDKELEKAFIKILSEHANEILKNSTLLNASIATVETIFKLDNLRIDSEMELVKALKRYIDANIESAEEIAVKLRPALQSIRFLIIPTKILCTEIRKMSLLTSDEIVSIIACKEQNSTTMPEGFSQSKIHRDFNREKKLMIRSLCEVFSGRWCCYCVYYSYDPSNHTLWDCTACFIKDESRNEMRNIYDKYKHVSLMEYNDDDLSTLYKLYRKSLTAFEW